MHNNLIRVPRGVRVGVGDRRSERRCRPQLTADRKASPAPNGSSAALITITVCELLCGVEAVQESGAAQDGHHAAEDDGIVTRNW